MPDVEAAREHRLDMDVHLLGPPSLILNTLERLQVETIEDLLALRMDQVRATRGVGTAKADAIAALRERAERSLRGGGAAEVLKGADTAPTLLEELVAARVDPDRPWEQLLVQLDTRTRNVLERAGLVTLRDVVVRHEAGTLTRIDGFGQAASSRLAEQLDQLVTLGYERYMWGEGGRPGSVEQALAQLVSELEARPTDQKLLRLRYHQACEEPTLEQLGEALGISRERVRQRLQRCLERGRRRWGPLIEELLAPLDEALRERGEILATDVALAQTGCATPRRLELALHLTGWRWRWCERGVGLTRMEAEAYEACLEALRRQLQARAIALLEVDELLGWARQAGWPGGREELVALARARWEVGVARDGRLINPFVDAATLHLRVLEELGEPASLGELAWAIQETLSEEEPPSERQLYLNLTRAEQAYYVARGVYQHASSLPIAPERLEALAHRALEALEGVDHAVSAGALLEQLRRDLGGDEDLEGVTPMLLREVLGRDARIQLFQSTDMVAHLDWFGGERVTQREHVAAVLAEAEEPLTCEQVCARMPTHVSFHPGAIHTTLQRAPEVLNLGRGRFLHRDGVGLTPSRLEALCEQAVGALLERGVPQAAPRLLEELPEGPSRAFLVAHPEGPAILYALLARHPRVASGSGQLVMALEAEGAELEGRDPVVEALEALLDEVSVETPAELGRLLLERHGWEASPSPIYHALARAERSGRIVRLFDTWRALRSAPVDALLEALQARGQDALERILASSPEANTALEERLREALEQTRER